MSILISNENFYYLLEKQNKEYFMNFFSSFVDLKFVKTCDEPHLVLLLGIGTVIEKSNLLLVSVRKISGDIVSGLG